MCGIAGVVSSDPERLAPIGAMTAALKHRGPDDEGFALVDIQAARIGSYSGPDTAAGLDLPRLPARPPEGVGLALGHRRLAILDLSSAGHGPMLSADGSLVVTYNGEIYNYLELREELRGLGHAFATGSDTEVLLAAWAEWGPECLHRFNGMWAFALYDTRQRLLFCARDRFGVKPFYYHSRPGFFAFASEIKGLLAHPGVPARADEGMVLGFLTRGALDEGSRTFFEGVTCLPGGHWLRLEPGRDPETRRYYELPACDDHSLPAAEFRDLLEDAVRLRLLRSDVDVGTCLSGGLDSSAIVALTAKLTDPRAASRRRTFSVLYDDPGMREEPFVEEVVAATGARGARATATSADLLRDLPALVRHQDEPLPSLGPYSQWRVMALAREHGVSVLLDGQGADELLAGYVYQLGPFLAEVFDRHGAARVMAEARALSRVTGRSLGFLLGLGAYHRLPMPSRLRALAIGRTSTHGHLPGSALDPAIRRRHGWIEGARHAPHARLANERRANVLSTSLPALLRYEDRNSMAFSIEARTPFLDYRVAEAAMRLPATDLVRDGWSKWILRESTRGLLPEAVRLRRDKLGFATPEKRWLEEIAPRVREWLGPGSFAAGLVRPDVLQGWLRETDAALARRRGLWRLCAVELWHREVRQDAHAS
ncbi:MAG: asparagine synthase (glutamine-hydrolyzing) [Vicinamibacteria bacterium]